MERLVRLTLPKLWSPSVIPFESGVRATVHEAFQSSSWMLKKAYNVPHVSRVRLCRRSAAQCSAVHPRRRSGRSEQLDPATKEGTHEYDGDWDRRCAFRLWLHIPPVMLQGHFGRILTVFCDYMQGLGKTVPAAVTRT